MQLLILFSRIPGHSGYCTSKYVTYLVLFARCTLISYSGHSAQLVIEKGRQMCTYQAARGAAMLCLQAKQVSSQLKSRRLPSQVGRAGTRGHVYGVQKLSLCIATEQCTHHFVKADFHIARGRYLFPSPSLLFSAPQPKGCLHVRSRLVTLHV